MADALTIQTHPLGKLAEDNDHLKKAQAILALVPAIVEPASWDQNGGPGAISLYSNPLSLPPYFLIVRQTQAIQGEVQAFLDQLKAILPTH